MLSTTSYQSRGTVVGYLAPRMPPAMDATESLSPPTFAAKRIASSAECMIVASASASGTILNGWFGNHRVAISSARSIGSDARSSYAARTAIVKVDFGEAPGQRLSACDAAVIASSRMSGPDAPSIAADTAAALAAAAAMARDPPWVEIEAS